MRAVINHMSQLQELMLIRDEQKVVGDGKHLQELDNAIRAMSAKLPEDVRQTYHKLLKRDLVVITPVIDGHCAGCGMKLAISHVQAIRLARQVQSCPSCLRVLYYPENFVRGVGRRPRRTEARKAGISRFSASSLMIPRLEASDKEGCLRELATRMVDEGFVDNADRLVEEALRREALFSTAVRHGMAFPHVRGVEGGGLSLALGIHPKGIDFGGAGTVVSKIVFFLAIPTAASAFYLKLLSGLTETFMDPEARKLLIAEREPEGVWKTLVKLTRSTIK